MRKAKIPGEKMASMFHEFSNEDIERLLENVVPATTKKANKFWNELIYMVRIYLMVRISSFLTNFIKKL